MEEKVKPLNAVPEKITGLLPPLFDQLDSVILGKSRQLRLAMACLLAKGHLLIEDVPGLGKTVLAHSLGKALGLEYKRVQFTSDLLPGDIIGVSIYDRNSSRFQFNEGPIFTNLLLADEINRATPKTQSALLEGMEEKQVSVEGNTRTLSDPFFVIATQNPSEQQGTFPLPESQLDRFLMRIEMGYPDRDAEIELFRGEDRREMLEGLSAMVDKSQLLAMQKQVDEVHVAAPIFDYIYRILYFTRQSGLFQNGLSTRAGLGLLRASRAWALVNGENKLLPGDVQAVLPSVAGHRLQPVGGNMTPDQIGERIIESISVE
ncbi:MAG: AAA domain-containing protein [Candidatus Nitronauta litoralis]|uniref:AAA domain-containing protein n=1 Tax=Candidatus Nitronauta litoralis TaxID=2705533 RepID=A0A7T0G0N3_9BACT|nr:MAG: AAA domain-containing protein [Candidatus Nitronauta litoralis]